MSDKDGSIVRRGEAIHIIGVGNTLVDIIIDVPQGFSAACGLAPGSVTHSDARFACSLLEDARNASKKGPQPQPPYEAAGGTAALAVSTAAMLGKKAWLYGCIGDDAAGEAYRRSLRERQVKSCLWTSASPTGRFIALVEPSGTPTIVVAPSAALELASFAPPDLAAATKASPVRPILHLDALLALHPASLRAWIEAGRAAAMTLSMDLSTQGLVRARRDELAALAPQVDYIFANEAEFRAYTRRDDIDAALAALASACPNVQWIVKMGPRGVWWRKNKELLHIDAPQGPILDTTGAGDAFAGAFLAGASEGRPAADSLALGQTAAGLVLATRGFPADAAALCRALRNVAYSPDKLAQSL